MSLFQKIKDSFFNLQGTTRANSISNNFQTKNVLNSDNMLSRKSRKLGTVQIEELYNKNAWVKKCVNTIGRELFKNGVNLEIEGTHKDKSEKMIKLFEKKYKSMFLQSVLETILYGGSLILKKDLYQDPMGEYIPSKTTELIHIPYVQYTAQPDYYEGTMILKGAKYWNIGTLGTVSPQFVVDFKADPTVYSEMQVYKYQGVGLVEGNIEIIKTLDLIISSLANATFRNGAMIYNVKDMKEVLSKGDATLVKAFFQNIEKMNNGVNSTAMLTIDGDDEMKPVEFKLSEYEKIMTNYIQYLIGIFGFTATKILSYSPSGLNSTGDSEIYLNAETMSVYQNMFIQQLKEVYEVMMFVEFGEEVEFNLSFKENFEKSEKEIAEIDRMNIDNAIRLQDVDTEEGLQYLLSRGTITQEEYDEMIKNISLIDEEDDEGKDGKEK